MLDTGCVQRPTRNEVYYAFVLLLQMKLLFFCQLFRAVLMLTVDTLNHLCVQGQHLHFFYFKDIMKYNHEVLKMVNENRVYISLQCWTINKNAEVMTTTLNVSL